MSRRRMRVLGVSATAALAVTAVVAGPPSAPAATTITMSGSTSVAPLASLLIRQYNKQFPGRARFRLAQGGSDVGVADVGAGRVSIGNSSRDKKSSDPANLVFNRIAKDAICIVTNPRNGVGNLSQAQIQGIFSGRIRDWSQVSGAKASGSINLVVRTAASGTQDAFQKIFMGSATVAGAASAKASNGLVQQTVQSDPNAVGYVSLDFVRGTSPSAYNGVACNLRNAKSGEYGGVRSFYMVTRGPATGATRTFIGWVQRSAAANKIVGTHWVPLH
jgi:phosphate transport system substrate-binding protein